MLAGPATQDVGGAPVLSLLEVPEGFEAATAALFDGELAAPLFPADREAPTGGSGWVELDPLAAPAALPDGVHPFAAEIGAPPALAPRLGQAGWGRGGAAGGEVQPRPLPGPHR